MIAQVISTVILAGTAVGVAPTAIDSVEGMRASHELNNLRSDAASIGRAVLEETLLSDTGETCPVGLDVTEEGRIAGLPSIRLGSAKDIKIWHDVTCARVQVVVTSPDGAAVAVWDNEAPQILTTHRDGTIVEQGR